LTKKASRLKIKGLLAIEMRPRALNISFKSLWLSDGWFLGFSLGRAN
jgi:hypothetical protein